ncbi:hypothetical protein R6Q59_006242 [Mikania micrantha]
MAERGVESDVSVDLTRESLIALAYALPDTLPDTDLSSPELPKSVKNVKEAVNTDEKDKLRSELISIAYAESPDTKDHLEKPTVRSLNHSIFPFLLNVCRVNWDEIWVSVNRKNKSDVLQYINASL